MGTINFKIKEKNIRLSWSNDEKFKKIYTLQTGPQHWKEINSDDVFYNKVINLINWNFERTLFANNIDINNLNSIIDVGSGLSLFDLALSQYNPNIKFYLVDKTLISINKNSKYFSTDNSHGFYNSWDVVVDVIKNSGLNFKQFKILSPTDEWPVSDLIVSMHSWCWHYPKEVYWSKLLSSLKYNGNLILDVLNLKERNMSNEISQELNSKFNMIPRVLSENSTHPFLNELTIKDDKSFGGCYHWIRKDNYANQ